MTRSFSVCASFKRQCARGLAPAALLGLVCLLVLAACNRNEPPATAFAATTGQVLVRAKNIKWGAAPPYLPPGAKATLMQGNPSLPGPYVMRLQLPAKYKIPFHSHTNAQSVTVVSGALFVANTATFDKKKAFQIRPGDFYHLPAQATQFVFTKGETVIEVYGIGPDDIKFVVAADDPRVGQGQVQGQAPGTPYSLTESFKGGELSLQTDDESEVIDMTF